MGMEGSNIPPHPLFAPPPPNIGGFGGKGK